MFGTDCFLRAPGQLEKRSQRFLEHVLMAPEGPGATPKRPWTPDGPAQPSECPSQAESPKKRFMTTPRGPAKLNDVTRMCLNTYRWQLYVHEAAYREEE